MRLPEMEILPTRWLLSLRSVTAGVAGNSTPLASALKSIFSAPAVERSAEFASMKTLRSELTVNCDARPSVLMTCEPLSNCTPPPKLKTCCGCACEASTTSVARLIVAPSVESASFEMPNGWIATEVSGMGSFFVTTRVRPESSVQLPLLPLPPCASMTTPRPTSTTLALVVMLPPAVAPPALNVPAAMRNKGALTSMRPPTAPASIPLTSSWPPDITMALPSAPPLLPRMISPPRLLMDCARTMPAWLTTVSAALDAPSMTTRPPLAERTPLAVFSALALAASAFGST